MRKKIFTITILVSLIVLLYFISSSVFSYWHPFPYCSISIKGQLNNGDEKSIKQAIRFLRKNDKSSYNDLCTYVEVIEERRCYNSDGHVDLEGFSKKHQGCYIRGTHRVYIQPNRDPRDSTDLLFERVEILKALAEKSKNFWTNYNPSGN